MWRPPWHSLGARWPDWMRGFRTSAQSVLEERSAALLRAARAARVLRRTSGWRRCLWNPRRPRGPDRPTKIRETRSQPMREGEYMQRRTQRPKRGSYVAPIEGLERRVLL